MQAQHQNQPTPLPEQLQYPWPPNLTAYEAKFFGVSATEGIAIGMGLLLPVAVSQSLGIPMVGGLLMGIGVALLVYMGMRKVNALGGVSVPVYVLLRLRDAGREETIELPLILGGSTGTVELETWEGETLMVLGDEA
jgi:hypothetical protein